MKHIPRQYAWAVYYGCVVLFVCFLITSSLVGTALFGRFELFVVRSESMLPALRVYDVVLVDALAPIANGTMITYCAEPGAWSQVPNNPRERFKLISAQCETTITHRVIETQEIILKSTKNNQERASTRFKTQGDNNAISDEWVHEQQVLGTVTWSGARGLGWFVLQNERSVLARLLLIWLPAGYFISVELRAIAKALQADNKSAR